MAMAGKLTRPAGWSRNPFRCGGTPLPLELLLAAKILVLVIVLRLVWRGLPDPFLPFLPVFDYLRHPPLFRMGLKVAVLTASVALLFNYRVRLACFVIGSVFLLGILASRVFFENNIMFLGCLFFLLGLYEAKTGPWLLRAQIILLYFAAAVNKLLDSGWRSGQFFGYWAGIEIKRSLYFQAASWLPGMLLPRAMSWITIAMEFGIALGFMFRRTRVWAIWLGLLLVVGMNFLTERTFGVFFYALPVSYLAFVTWPRTGILVLYDGDCGFCTRTRRMMVRFDSDRQFAWQPFQQAEDLHGISSEELRHRLYVIAGEKKYSGFAAFKMMALYNPITYFLMLLPLLPMQPWYSNYRSWLAVSFLLFFSPLFAPIGEAAYAWVARNRHGVLNGVDCSVTSHKSSSSVD
jgi:predicted DCC family thiol-disulfide oxidoreductase YuxK